MHTHKTKFTPTHILKIKQDEIEVQALHQGNGIGLIRESDWDKVEQMGKITPSFWLDEQEDILQWTNPPFGYKKVECAELINL